MTYCLSGVRLLGSRDTMGDAKDTGGLVALIVSMNTQQRTGNWCGDSIHRFFKSTIGSGVGVDTLYKMEMTFGGHTGPLLRSYWNLEGRFYYVYAERISPGLYTSPTPVDSSRRNSANIDYYSGWTGNHA
ncbi:hypothetical protein MPER_12865 [Moniliophthora perniciosa FA553]|nr:hypothetical protein MPER_12865 [Moniliophthora perniciosa FA553]